MSGTFCKSYLNNITPPWNFSKVVAMVQHSVAQCGLQPATIVFIDPPSIEVHLVTIVKAFDAGTASSSSPQSGFMAHLHSVLFTKMKRRLKMEKKHIAQKMRQIVSTQQKSSSDHTICCIGWSIRSFIFIAACHMSKPEHPNQRAASAAVASLGCRAGMKEKLKELKVHTLLY